MLLGIDKAHNHMNTCDQEPIHRLGQVQSHGYLISLNSDWTIEHVSKNIIALLQLEIEKIVGNNLHQFVSLDVIHSLKIAFQKSMSFNASQPLYSIALFFEQPAFDVSIHQNSEKKIILEFETANKDIFSVGNFNFINEFISDLSQCQLKLELLKTVAISVKEFTQFDRVMVYQFHYDQSGEVVSEEVGRGMQPFLGLRFPASDIPIQARQLYTQHPIRLIADVNAAPHPVLSIVHEEKTTLDLGGTHLRGVSPIHIQYLKNMGVESSLSVSIIIDNTLWGLIACHHLTPKKVSLYQRDQLISVAKIIALEIQIKQQHEQQCKNVKRENFRNNLHKKIKKYNNINEIFLSSYKEISALLECDGIGIYFNKNIQVNGLVPEEEEIKIICDFVKDNNINTVTPLNSIIESIDCLSIKTPFYGVLIIPFSEKNDVILIFRRSQTQFTHWAGNPNKSAQQKEGNVQLTPRSSFNIWVEENNKKCLPWTDENTKNAKIIQVIFLEFIYRKSLEEHENVKKSQKKQQILIAELNHRVRNILYLVNAIISQTTLKDENVEEYIKTITGRIMSLSKAHNLLTEKKWNFISLYVIFQTELGACELNINKVNITGQEILVTPSATTSIILTIHELFTNAIKHGSLSGTCKENKGTIDISWKKKSTGVYLSWIETKNKNYCSSLFFEKKESHGFGMQLILYAIPHELGGTVQYEVKHHGFSITIFIPEINFL